MLPKFVEEGTLVYCWWACKLIQPLWKTIWKFLKKSEAELVYDPASLLLGVFSKESKSLS